MTPSILQLNHVSKKFADRTVVADLMLEIAGPQVVGLLGPNGAGKSTLMRLVAGFLPPDSGSITVDGHPMDTAGQLARAALGYLPENAPAHPGMRVNETLAFTASMRDLHGKRAKEAIAETVRQCQLEPVLTRLASQLSKGYRHRLGLALALLHRPRLLVMDEPTDGLDPIQKLATRALIRQLGRQCAIIVSTHLLDEVPEICDRVLMMDHGQLVYDGPVPADLPKAFGQHVMHNA